MRRKALRKSGFEPLRGGAHFDSKLRDFRGICRIARYVAQVPQARAIGSAGAFHPGQRERSDDGRGQKRKLETRIRER